MFDDLLLTTADITDSTPMGGAIAKVDVAGQEIYGPGWLSVYRFDSVVRCEENELL